ncbi:endoplasmic reticulum protein [Coprinopsis sp. MPI-PUGE-AT-0042]|nr:endoplasmic reticulum protein [Coprinopsis sp. MPI-PUGE-AT-0042]
MDAIFLPLANSLGASVDQIKLIFCLLVAYPLGSLFVRVPASQPALRHLFSVCVALLFFFPVLRIYSAFFQLLGSVLATYFVAKYDTSKKMPWLVFVIVMGHLTFNHVIRALYGFSYETMEVTGPQMVLTMKLTTFAWNVHDGRRKGEELDKWQLAKRVTKYPSILEFLGYSFYFPGILVGPYLDYAEYMDLINETRAAYTRLVKGLVFLGAFVALNPTFNYLRATTDEFASNPLWYRIVPVFLTGLGFTGFGPGGEAVWNGAANVHVMAIEFPSNFKVLLDSWNMKTNVWLRECVYKRVTPKGKKPGFSSSMITFGTSAFWHGIASGYYFTFMMGGFITTAARLVRSNIRPFFLPAEGQPPSLNKKLYDLAGTIVSIVVLNYTASPFIILTARGSFQAWHNLAYHGHILMGIVIPERKPAVKKEDKAANGNGNGFTSSAASSARGTPVSEKNFQFPPAVDTVLPPKLEL